MKLASYDDGSRDGHLVVVARDMAAAHYATGIATRLQQVLDDWGCLAPLPRAYRWARDRGDGLPPCHDAGDALRGAEGDVPAAGEKAADGLVAEAGIAVITSDVAQDAVPGPALDGVRLMTLRSVVDPAVAAFAPLAVTPDELDGAWRHGRVGRALDAAVDGHQAPGNPSATGPHAGSIDGMAAAVRAVVRRGQTWRVELPGADRSSVCGAIRQRVAAR